MISSLRPDFLNSLEGVLTRFRIDKIAVVDEIKQMTHQVLVDTQDRRYSRFCGGQKET